MLVNRGPLQPHVHWTLYGGNLNQESIKHNHIATTGSKQHLRMKIKDQGSKIPTYMAGEPK